VGYSSLVVQYERPHREICNLAPTAYAVCNAFVPQQAGALRNCPGASHSGLLQHRARSIQITNRFYRRLDETWAQVTQSK